jgi:HK97 family phage portal protein
MPAITARPPSLIATRHPERSRARVPAPITDTGTMSGVWAEILGLTSPDTIAATGDQVRGLPALDRAKGLVVNSVATMLVAASVIGPDGQPVDKPASITRPHPLLQSFEFFEQVLDNAVMHGNYVGVRVGRGEDLQIVPVPLGAVSVDASSGLPWYTINGEVYHWREIFHVRANAPVGTWWGLGVVEKFRRSLLEALYSQKYGMESFKSGSVPSLDVMLDIENPTQTQIDDAKAGFVEKFGGGNREPIVHGKGISVNPLSWSPHDAEFVQARQLSLAEAALMVGLRPEDIGATAGSSMTYGNRSDDALQRITDGYGPWMSRVEGPLSDLLGPGFTVKGNPEALLRTSTRERLEIREIAQRIGVETPDESRAEEGRGPIHTATTEGDTQ